MFTIDKAKILLQSAGVFFDADDFDQDPDTWNKYILNMSDTWAWGCADCEEVKESELPELALLFFRYGWAGILYWTSQKRDNMRSEFLDINRLIDFVRHEEELIKNEPNSSKRAYKKIYYTLGEQPRIKTFIDWLLGRLK